MPASFQFDGETKLDKAEILELTVNHLTTEQRRSANSDRYNQGFNDCTRETIQFLITNGILDAVSLSRLQGHLDSICRQTTTHRPSVTVPMETNQHLLSQRLCSTPQSYVSVPQFSCDISMTTSSSSSLSDFKLSSSSNCEDSLYGASSGSLSENYVLGNIICDEKPWRPW